VGDTEQLKKKVTHLEIVAEVCEVNAEEVLEDIAVSVETTNKLTKSLHSQDETKDPYLQWWATFLEEWGGKCFRRCLAKCGNSKDYQGMLNLWLGGFEVLWMVGCDMVRIIRLNDLREGITRVIARETPSKTDMEQIWRWHNESTNQLDEAVSKMIDLFGEKQRQAIAQTLKELKEYDEASLLGKLKRLMSE